MKTTAKRILIIALMLMSYVTTAQTIAVSDLSTNGVSATPIIAGKLARLEVVKLGKYTVLDEFDMTETLQDNPDLKDCYGNKCLTKLGQKLNVEYVLSGAVDGIGDKIVVNLKLIDVKNKTIAKTHVVEFEDQEMELQRMIGIVLQEMHDVDVDEAAKKNLQYRNDVITTNNVGKINNTGPRMGISYIIPGKDGDLYDLMTRKEKDGGLELLPVMSHVGFQFEKQYIGTENFSALGEMLINFSGMEQGQFLPSLTLMNGFRFGKAGWEVAFGPSFGVRRIATGIISDADGTKRYYTSSEWEAKNYDDWYNNPNNFNPDGSVAVAYTPPTDPYISFLDKRGDLKLNTSWVMAVGRTFRYGALNMPVNIYYTSDKHGSAVGLSAGFNIVRKKKRIHERR